MLYLNNGLQSVLTNRNLFFSILFENCADRTNGLTVSAVKAVAPVDNSGNRAEINAALRTDGAAGLTADAVVIDEVSLL